jgi:hypothetical protein
VSIVSELLVGTKKGLFTLHGEPGDTFEIGSRDFPGELVEFATRDPRTGRTFASVTDGHYGPRIFLRDEGDRDWRQAAGPEFPEDTGASLERIWVVKPGEADGVLYAGVAPAALFSSTDNGETWELNRALWNVPTRPEWNPGAGGLALHSICPWPGDPERMAVGISAAGVWITEDAGQTWRTGYTGMVPLYEPEETRGETRALRSQHAPGTAAATAALHAVPRQRVSLRRRGRHVDRHRGRAPVRLRLPAGARSRRPRQRLRDPALG